MSNTPPQGTTAAAGAAEQAPAQQQGQPSPGEIDNMVASYLQKKGYKATEAIFARESKGDIVSLDDLGDGIKKETGAKASTVENNSKVDGSGDQVMDEAESNQDDLDVYDISYKSLREWIENSLDWYKVECCMFPTIELPCACIDVIYLNSPS